MDKQTSAVGDTKGDLVPASSDLEVGQQANTSLLITWASDEDPGHPHNWHDVRKWVITVLLSLGGLVTLMSGAMLAPALASIASDLDTSQDEAQIFLSVFVLSFAFGPMALAPLAEAFGRRPVWIVSSCFYILWNTVAGFSTTSGLLIASRLLAGIGASVDFAVCNPVLADLWPPSQRGKSFAIATFIPLLGPALGPIIGGAVTQTIGWRWLFWVLSIFNGLLVLVGLVVFPETYEIILLRQRAAKLRKQTGQPYYVEDDGSEPLRSKLYRALTRPVRLLATQPILQVMSLFLAYNFGILYIVLSTFASLWMERYDQTEAQSGLHYLALVMGYTFAAQMGARLTDRIWHYLKAKAGNKDTAPEYRVPLMVPGAVLIPTGLFIYGWTAERHTHWIWPDVGIALFGCGIILNTQAMQAYVMDAYRTYLASASAASQFLRSIAGFAFPLFAPLMYRTLGYGWGNSLLAFLSLAIGLPAPLLLWRYGARIRAMGKPQW
ncbi:major facilitator superfamily domain-containing protein [Achaetomium macrosporum]|uniref:Major facilitator superfamily domain-containing protein n=1 Tax=Achaetomium macrosporum TaxID=79813 RepID=A0AAN7C4N9_9PEZI|nr:major facilitator superfamily domain-containing protein [Achaetomium macrosporum]